MSKHWEVLITARGMAYVNGADTQEEAVQFAKDEFGGLIDFNETECEARELKTKIDIESCRRHADVKSEES